MLQYLFGFSGRINRARMWLFILVTLGWEMVAGLVAVIGLNGASRWSSMADLGARIDAVFRYPYHLGAVESPLNWGALGIFGLLILLWFVAMLAVTTKRLHDRNMGAVWVIPFVLLPWGIHVMEMSGAIAFMEFGPHLIPFGAGYGLARLVGSVLSIWAFLELFCFRGTAGPNQYGPDPLA